MKAIISDIAEMTDSRQLMESKPIPAFTWFIYILLSLIVMALIWSYFGTIDEYTSVRGMVRPVNQIQTVQMPFSGKINKVYVKEGQSVKKGDTLFSVDTTDIEQQKQLIEKQVSVLTTAQTNLQKLRECVISQKNTFNENSADENMYYIQCQKYLNDVAAAKVTIANGNVDVKQSKADSAASIASTNQQIAKQNQTITELQTLIDSVTANINKFSDNGSVYAQRYLSYKSKADAVEGSLKQDLQRETLVTLETEMATQKSSLTQLTDAKDKVENASNALNSKSDSNTLSLKTLELTMLAQTDQAIETNKSNLLSLNEKLDPYSTSIKKATVKAETDGIVNFAVSTDVNSAVEQNVTVIDIIPQNSERKVTLTVPENNISKVKKDQKVKIQINSLDYSDYGYATGTIDKISSDVQYDKTSGQSFYVVDAKVSQTELKKQNGNAEEIKVGMSCDAKIISGQKKILFWALEKLDFLH